MSFGLFSELTSRLSLEGIDIDNWTFKFYNRASVGLFLLAAAMVTADSYTGEKITCKEGADDYDKQYCWLHGGKHLTPNEVGTSITLGDRCFSYGEEDNRATNYYVWISLVLLFSGIMFIIPNELWKHFEGGMMEQFKSSKQDFLEDSEKSASIFKKLSKNQTRRYFFTFVFFEMLNFVVGLKIFLLTDWFLNGKFSTYGLKTIAYLQGNAPYTEMDTGNGGDKSVQLNPMCSVFPTTVGCDIISFGVNGKADTKSHLCILGQNIMNQKIYLVLWVWFVVLFSVSACMIIYRVLTCMLPGFQRREIQGLLKSTDDYAVRKLKLDFDHIGNYFVLTQIGRNATPYTFRKFLDEVVDRPFTKKVNEEEKTKKTIELFNESTADSTLTSNTRLPSYNKVMPNEAPWNVTGMEMGHRDEKKMEMR